MFRCAATYGSLYGGTGAICGALGGPAIAVVGLVSGTVCGIAKGACIGWIAGECFYGDWEEGEIERNLESYACDQIECFNRYKACENGKKAKNK